MNEGLGGQSELRCGGSRGYTAPTYMAVSMGTWYATQGSAKRSSRCLAPAVVKAYECMHRGAHDRYTVGWTSVRTTQTSLIRT
jgi:hypothetical protein